MRSRLKIASVLYCIVCKAVQALAVTESGAPTSAKSPMIPKYSTYGVDGYVTRDF